MYRIFSHCLIVLSFVFPVFVHSDVVSSIGARTISSQMYQFDGLYSGVVDWILLLEDPDSGGFYESLGLKKGTESRKYQTDIQSTYFAIQILNDSGVLSNLDDKRKKALIEFFHVRQSADTGYFVDPGYPEMLGNQRVLGRALMFSVNALRILDSSPLYPLPGQQHTNVKLVNKASSPAANNEVITNRPDHLSTAKEFHQWLENLPWERPWSALDRLSSQSFLVDIQQKEHKTMLVNLAVEFVSSIQDQETGLIGNASLNEQLSAAFKLSSFCKTFDRPIPRAAELRKTVLGWYADDQTVENIFFIRNVGELLLRLIRETGMPLNDQELARVIKVTGGYLSQFQRSDGGFSSYLSDFYISPNDLYTSTRRRAEAGEQSDLNGTSSAWALKKTLHNLIEENQ